MPRTTASFLALLLAGSLASAAAPIPNGDRIRCPRPESFAFVFSAGYAGDKLPTTDTDFERMLTTIQKGGFTVVHCTYSDARLRLCKKHGVQMMIDLLDSEHHVYKNPEQARKLCERLRGEKAVWGYNIWNDPVGKTGPGRHRDILNVRRWDNTHPAYCGTYRVQGLRHLDNADMIGYYDFHWKRGIDMHFGHLLAFHRQAKAADALFMTWLSSSSGLAGKGNLNRSLYSATTALACGAKGIIWYLGTELLDLKTMKWTVAGGDILAVHKRVAPFAQKSHLLGLPETILTTRITKTANDRPLENMKDRLPPGLENNAIPRAYWLQCVEGECLLGVFRDANKRAVVFVVNHNAYAEQTVKLKAVKAKKVSQLAGAKKDWQSMPIKEGMIEVKLAGGGGVLLRFEE